MRSSIAFAICFAFATTLVAAGTDQSVAADDLLQRGRDSYRSGAFADAAKDLGAAVDAYLNPQQVQAYVNSGQFATLPKLETALVYLVLADQKLGRQNEAREALRQLQVAERIEPTYARLPLTNDVMEFESVAKEISPDLPLPANQSLASIRAGGPPLTEIAQTQPAPAVAPAPAPAPAATTTTTTTTVATAAPAPAPAPATTAPAPTAVATATPAQQPIEVQPTLQEQRAAMARELERRVAEVKAEAAKQIAAEREAAQKKADEEIAAARAAAEKQAQDEIAAQRAAIDKEAQERIASERAAAEKAAQEKIAAERAAAEKEAQERIAAEQAAAQKAADEKIAAERAAAQKSADEQIAAARAAAEKQAAEQVAAARAEAQREEATRIADARAAAAREAEARVAAAQAEAHRAVLDRVRQADSAALNGRVDEANGIYVSLLNSPNVPRGAIADIATGLYRTGDFKDAVAAFAKLGNFAKGEEDLRYYDAVSLFETGKYDEAKKQLACALPYIQVNEDVARYRTKIEKMAGQQAMK